jgi:hypothetical protein
MKNNHKLEFPPKIFIEKKDPYHKGDIREILSYLKRSKEGVEKWQRMKLVTIGNGSSGKVQMKYSQV